MAIEQSPIERWQETKSAWRRWVIMVLLGYPLYLGGSFLWKHRPGHCVANVQADLDAAIPEDDPVVEKCNAEDGQGNALCFVRRLEDGQPRTRAHWWNCSQRNDPKIARLLLKQKPWTPSDSE